MMINPKNLFKNRRATCTSCSYFIKNNCTKCNCPGAGKIKKIESRCPENKWSDGWESIPKIEASHPINYQNSHSVFWDEESNEWISEEDYYNKFPFLKILIYK